MTGQPDWWDEIAGYEDDGTPFTNGDLVIRVAQIAGERGDELLIGEDETGEWTFKIQKDD